MTPFWNRLICVKVYYKVHAERPCDLAEAKKQLADDPCASISAIGINYSFSADQIPEAEYRRLVKRKLKGKR